MFASVLTFACNNYSYKDDVPTSSVSYTSVSTLQKDDCDLSKIKKVKLYNYCCNSGWANTPATLTIYGKSSSYTNVKDTDSFFEDLPFSDFVTDVYGNVRYYFPDGSFANDWITINGVKYFFQVVVNSICPKCIDIIVLYKASSFICGLKRLYQKSTF